MPALVSSISRTAAGVLGKLFGVEAMLASRSLAASLRRTSVLVGALATAVAMMVSVGIMVGSFRQTMVTWMNNQLPADLYLRPAGDAAADRHPTISVELAEKIAVLPGVAVVDRLRAYEISYNGMPATLASVDLRVLRAYRKSDFFSGRPTSEVLDQLRGKNNIIVSEPFTYKHKVKTGDTITLALGEALASFQIVDVFYDYASERGYVLMDRDVLLKYLPDETPTNLAVFVAADAKAAEVRKEIQEVAAGHRILIFSDRDLRTEAVRIFDRTFAITYALEAVALILVFVINKQSFGWTIRFHWPIAVLLGALTVVYAATVVSGLYPARVAVRLNPLEVIHEE